MNIVDPSAAYAELRHQVAAFAADKIAPRVPAMEETREVDVEASHLIAQQGWLGVTIPKTHGGMGLGHVAKTVITEELARTCAAMGAMFQASTLGTSMIIHFGSKKQKKQWLPLIAAGTCLPTIATTERQSGSHVLGMEATAERDGDDYVLNGHKVYVGNSHVAQVHGVVARTGDGKRGCTAFLVEADRPGLSLVPHRRAMGLHGFSFGELRFDNCRVPAANRLGVEGDGLAVAYSSSILYGRPNLTAVSLGVHQATVDDTIAFAKQRHLYGQPLHAMHHIKQMLGTMESRLMTARALAYQAVAALDAGEACDKELMNAKLQNYRLSVASALDSLEIHGAAGVQTDWAVERYFRDAVHMWAPAGTGHIQALKLAETALGEKASRQQWSERFAGT